MLLLRLLIFAAWAKRYPVVAATLGTAACAILIACPAWLACRLTAHAIHTIDVLLLTPFLPAVQFPLFWLLSMPGAMHSGDAFAATGFADFIVAVLCKALVTGMVIGIGVKLKIRHR
jgi:hypothetical protein